MYHVDVMDKIRDTCIAQREFEVGTGRGTPAEANSVEDGREFNGAWASSL
jgi:hypothetical protein